MTTAGDDFLKNSLLKNCKKPKIMMIKEKNIPKGDEIFAFPLNLKKKWTLKRSREDNSLKNIFKF